MEFSIDAEVDQQFDQLTADDVDSLADALAPYWGRVTRSTLGRARLTMTLQAVDFDQAVAVSRAVLRSVAGDRELASLSVLRSSDAQRLSGTPPSDDWLSVSEMAAESGLSRQAVLHQISSGRLAATKVGTTWIIARPRTWIEARPRERLEDRW